MKINLTDAIVNHIFDHLGLTLESKLSLKNNNFLLDQTLEYVDTDGNDANASIWGSQVTIENSKFRLMVVDFSGKDLEYALIVKLDGCPSYACYLGIDWSTGDPYDGLICFSFKANSWLKAPPGIQGTFLAGMENLKDVNAGWAKIIKHDDLLEELKSFIQFQDNFSNEDEDEANDEANDEG